MMDDIGGVSADNRGVSPVIGVILMVAITVILAAVIGTFVLGLGDSLEQTPQASFGASAGSAGNSVVLSHNGGDAIPASDLDVQVGGTTYDFTDSTSPAYAADDEFQVGNTAEFSATFTDGQVRVRLIHTPSESIIFEKTVQQ